MKPGSKVEGPPGKAKARVNQRAEVADEKGKEKGAMRPPASVTSAASLRRPMLMGSSVRERPSRRHLRRQEPLEELRKEAVPQ